MSRTRHTVPLQNTIKWIQMVKPFFGISIFQSEPISTSRPPGTLAEVRSWDVLGYILSETIPQMFKNIFSHIYIYIYNIKADSLRPFKSPKTSEASCTNKDGPLLSIGTPGWWFWYERALLRQRSRCFQLDVTIVVRLMEKNMMRTICSCSSLRSNCDSDISYQ